MSKWVRLLGVAATLTLTASEVAQAGTCTVSFKGNTCSVETATAAQCCSVETVIPCGNFTFHGGHYWDGLGGPMLCGGGGTAQGGGVSAVSPDPQEPQ